MDGFEKFIDEDGILFLGTREQLEEWKNYKKSKALRFVERGYSVEWEPNGDNFMKIYIPENKNDCRLQTEAAVRFFMFDQDEGIDYGKIDRLMINSSQKRMAIDKRGAYYVETCTLLDYNQNNEVTSEELKKRLARQPIALGLLEEVLEELN